MNVGLTAEEIIDAFIVMGKLTAWTIVIGVAIALFFFIVGWIVDKFN